MTIRETMEAKNESPLCNYYGSLDNSIKPKYGVHLFMLNDYIERTMQEQKEKAKNDFQKMNDSFRKLNSEDVNVLKESVKVLSIEVKELSKLIKNIVTDNKLVMPKKIEFEKKK
jgi:hypothetical protein